MGACFARPRLSYPSVRLLRTTTAHCIFSGPVLRPCKPPLKGSQHTGQHLWGLSSVSTGSEGGRHRVKKPTKCIQESEPNTSGQPLLSKERVHMLSGLMNDCCEASFAAVRRRTWRGEDRAKSRAMFLRVRTGSRQNSQVAARARRCPSRARRRHRRGR